MLPTLNLHSENERFSKEIKINNNQSALLVGKHVLAQKKFVGRVVSLVIESSEGIILLSVRVIKRSDSTIFLCAMVKQPWDRRFFSIVRS